MNHEGHGDPEQIIAIFQRRRRLTFLILSWTTGLGLGGVLGGFLLLSSLHNLREPPYWLFAGMVLSMLIFAAGSLCAPHVYRCPRCNRRVHVPDPTESGYVLIKDPASCPHCGVALKERTNHDPTN